MGAEAIPDWMRIPQGQWTADDLDLVPEEVGRCEVLDGALIVMSPQRAFHSIVIRRLANLLEFAAPPEWKVLTEMTVRIDEHNRPEPDIVVLRPGTSLRRDTTTCFPPDMALAIEVVSPDSMFRDRVIKPEKFAAAGIPQYWRIEDDHGETVAHLFALNDRGKYVETAVERGKVRLDQPFPHFLDVDRLYP
ncbi:Uma2 family endonuclease [Cryptosporangium minutisporangium]|uniref:Uma2 family endonuclease n=1 Tax=Cryptosporangium minutisporangium TaxID=113569 RepID=A0ABP6T1R7_9ACTN